jgi:hypothetical protein
MHELRSMALSVSARFSARQLDRNIFAEQACLSVATLGQCCVMPRPAKQNGPVFRPGR